MVFHIPIPCLWKLPTGSKAFVSQVEEGNRSLLLYFIKKWKGSRNAHRGSVFIFYEKKNSPHIQKIQEKLSIIWNIWIISNTASRWLLKLNSIGNVPKISSFLDEWHSRKQLKAFNNEQSMAYTALKSQKEILTLNRAELWICINPHSGKFLFPKNQPPITISYLRIRKEK